MHGIMSKLCIALLFGFCLALGGTGEAAIPVKADNVQTSKILDLRLNPVRKRICQNQKIILGYSILFDRVAYSNQKTEGGLAPLAPLVPLGKKRDGPVIDVIPSQGTVSYDKVLVTKLDPVVRYWYAEISFTPNEEGEATVTVEATYYFITVQDKWTFIVKPCKFDVEISADESGARLSSGQTFNEAQKFWQIVIYLKGKVTGVEVEKKDNPGGSGGTKKIFSSFNTLWNNDPYTGTTNSFGDGIWLGNAPDMVCGTKGALTCTNEFEVNPELVDDTLKLQIDMRSGQCSGFTVWCKGDDGGGEVSIPPLQSLAFSMDASIPADGGTSHYIHMLPYGVTFDILISAFPEVEE